MFDRKRYAPIEMLPEDFRTIGYRLVDRIAELRDSPCAAGYSGTRTARQAEAGRDVRTAGLPHQRINFRTSLEDIPALPGLVIRLGRGVDAILRTEQIKSRN
jgi:hypothetical protein